MDRDDWLYLVSAVCISAGAALLTPGAGLIAFGAMLGLPLVIGMTRKGPQK